MYGCNVEIDFYEYYPAVINTLEQTNSFTSWAKSLLGDNLVSEKDLPIPGSEDFSFFLE
jgi:metal-dependent amidase/aminoacylase/carboxypeptidase family protein